MTALAARLAVAGLALALAAPGGAQAQNRFWLVNGTQHVIQRVEVTIAGRAAWGEDLLGGNALPPRQAVLVTPGFSDCVLDIRVAYIGAEAETRQQVNACRLVHVVFGRADPGLPHLLLPDLNTMLEGPTRGTRIEPVTPWGLAPVGPDGTRR